MGLDISERLWCGEQGNVLYGQGKLPLFGPPWYVVREPKQRLVKFEFRQVLSPEGGFGDQGTGCLSSWGLIHFMEAYVWVGNRYP